MALGDFLKRPGGAKGPAPTSRLAARMAYYTSWHAPHLGTNGAYPGSSAPRLDEPAFRANLQAYLTVVPERVAQLAGLLAGFDLDVAEGYEPARRPGFIRGLHLTLRRELPALYRPELRDFLRWESSARSGDEIVFSLLGDIAMLFADIVRQARPGCFVGMNLDPRNRKMTSYGRPCVLGLADPVFPVTRVVLDFEEEMFGVYRRMKDPEIAFADAAHVGNDVGSALIGNTVLVACARYAVDPDLAHKRAETWMARAV